MILYSLILSQIGITDANLSLNLALAMPICKKIRTFVGSIWGQVYKLGQFLQT